MLLRFLQLLMAFDGNVHYTYYTHLSYYVQSKILQFQCAMKLVIFNSDQPFDVALKLGSTIFRNS